MQRASVSLVSLQKYITTAYNFIITKGAIIVGIHKDS
nr:MAG TPA: hypothetical protein [Caudoviricetes sp.]